MAIDISEPTPYATFLHYGLFVGAIFQIICIMAVVFIPERSCEKDDDEVSSPSSSTTARTNTDHSRRGKKEKKKYR